MHTWFAVAVLSLVQFLKICISQGSAATRLTCGGTGISNDSFSQIFRRVCQWKNFENQSLSSKDTDNITSSFWPKKLHLNSF